MALSGPQKRISRRLIRVESGYCSHFGGCRPLTLNATCVPTRDWLQFPGRPAISVGSLTFGLVDYPNPCHPDVVRQDYAGESDVGSPGIGADGATTPETLRHQDRLAGRSGERRNTASTEGDIRAARCGLISQVPRQMGPIGRLRPIRPMSDRGGPSWHTLPLLAPA
jgi:hypothetical protein